MSFLDINWLVFATLGLQNILKLKKKGSQDCIFVWTRLFLALGGLNSEEIKLTCFNCYCDSRMQGAYHLKYIL